MKIRFDNTILIGGNISLNDFKQLLAEFVVFEENVVSELRVDRLCIRNSDSPDLCFRNLQTFCLDKELEYISFSEVITNELHGLQRIAWAEEGEEFYQDTFDDGVWVDKNVMRVVRKLLVHLCVEQHQPDEIYKEAAKNVMVTLANCLAFPQKEGLPELRIMDENNRRLEHTEINDILQKKNETKGVEDA